MKNVEIPFRLKFYPISPAAPNQFSINSGAAGWIDTDISGSDVPADARAIWLFSNSGSANVNSGARATGETTDSHYSLGAANVVRYLITNQSSARRVEFYRDAAANQTYCINGYFR